VVLYLTKNFGIDKSYFEVMGLPDDYEPDLDLSSDELRRVEFSLTDKPTAGGNSEASDAQPKTLLKPVTLEDLLVSNIVYFTRRQVTPSKTDRRKIADLGSALVLSGTTDNVVLYGYSDGRGKAADNRWLVEECCRAVAKILRSSGIPDSQIIIRPVVKPKSADGAENVETKPIREDDSVPPMPEENPRRVELKLEPPVINEKNSDEDSVSPVPDVST
jgi:outer membrane protein OmpA-like peptidoglycan-associated protein